MNTQSRIDAAHQALGEFVVVFQWVENLYRQIGWFILDPERKQWPPTQLRKETNCKLINNVTDMFTELTEKYDFANGAEKAKEMLNLQPRFHDLRKYRNRLLHSTYVELKTGGEVDGYMRSNPEVGVDPETGELIYDQEDFSANAIHAKMHEFAECMLRLNMIHVQLINWSPFARHGSLVR